MVTEMSALGSEFPEVIRSLQRVIGAFVALLITHVGGNESELILVCRVSIESTGTSVYEESGKEIVRGAVVQATFLSLYFL